jgi:ParB-like chromosome segregation protein Spo0J
VNLKLSDIRRDNSAQPRAMLNTDHIKDLADALEDGGELTPVDVFYDGFSYWLADGFHRWSAYHRAKREEIPVTVHEGDLRAAILYGITANNQHGVLKLTREEKRASVVKLLKDEEWGKWPQGQIDLHPVLRTSKTYPDRPTIQALERGFDEG